MEIALTAVCGFLFGFLTATMILTRLYDKCESYKLKDYKINESSDAVTEGEPHFQAKKCPYCGETIISRIVIKKLNGDSHEHVE